MGSASPPAAAPKSWFRKGKVAVRPSSSSPSSRSWGISPSIPSAPPKADIISLVRFSRSSSVMPIFWIMSSMGLMPSSLAHLRHSPSFLDWPPSNLVIKTTATCLWQRLHMVGCIYANTPSGREKFFGTKTG